MRAEEQIIPWMELEKMLEILESAIRDDDFERIRDVLRQAVSGFAPQCEIGDLLWNRRREEQ
jgi:FlaA1/EpsC-like NDP-sugar epimerase